MEGKFAKLKGNVVCSAIRKNITRCAKCSISFLGKDIYIYCFQRTFFFLFSIRRRHFFPILISREKRSCRVNTTTLRSGIVVYELSSSPFPVSIRNFNRSHNRVSPKSIPLSILLLSISFLPPLPPPPPPCFHHRVPDKAVQGLWRAPSDSFAVHAAGCSAIEGTARSFQV